MTAEATTPSPAPPRPPLRLVVDGEGRVCALGFTDLIPGTGERVLTLPDEAYAAFVAADEAIPGDTDAVYYDEATGTFRGVGVRGRMTRAPRTYYDEATGTFRGVGA